MTAVEPATPPRPPAVIAAPTPAEVLDRPDADPTTARARPRASRVVAWVWLGVIALAALVGPLLPLAEGSDPARALDAPVAQRPDLLSRHPLGTDRQGLDLLAQVVEGARTSLAVAGGAILLAGAVGTGLGLLAGFRRGRWDAVAGTLGDSLLAFPPLILLLAIVAAFTASVPILAVALGVVVLPTYLRLVRAGTLRVAQAEFVDAARLAGATPLRIALREILPTVSVPVVTYSFVVSANLVVAEASLSFLGVGIQRPRPTWGNMIAAGQADLTRDPHLVLVPAAVLFLTVFSLNQIGEAARSRLDPREAKL